MEKYDFDKTLERAIQLLHQINNKSVDNRKGEGNGKRKNCGE